MSLRSIDIADKTTLDAVKATVDSLAGALGSGSTIADKQTLDNVHDKLDELAEGLGFSNIYGVKVDRHDSNPFTRVHYTMGSVGKTPAAMNYTTGQFNYGDWENVWFIKENYPVMLNYDGTVAYRLNPNDYTKKMDGTDSDVANTTFAGNAMSRFPLIWLHMSEDTSYEYISVANYKVDETYHAYPFTRQDGEIRPEMFLSIYKGSLVSGKLRSISGQVMIMNNTAQQEIDAALANNPSGKTGWYTRTWAQRNLVNALLIIIGRSTNTQVTFGNGDYASYDASNADGRYGMVLPGSVMNQKGQFWGTQGDRDQVKVFHCEDWWGNQWERIAGLINDHGIIKVKMTPPYNTTGEGYTPVPGLVSPPTGYIVENSCTELGRIPSVTGGSATTYDCD